jgi:hypothetical protein
MDDRCSIHDGGTERIFFSSPPLCPDPPSLLSSGYVGIKMPGREADRSHPFSVKVKKAYLHSPIRLNGTVLSEELGHFECKVFGVKCDPPYGKLAACTIYIWCLLH